MQAHVYLLQDMGVEPNKFYVGFKVGDFWDIRKKDSYHTSSKIVKPLLSTRPQDFRWFLVACGNKKEMMIEEMGLLKSVDARKNPLYYNQSNGTENFVCKKHSEETKLKFRNRTPWNKGLTKFTNKSLAIISEKQKITLKGRIPSNKGISLTLEQKFKAGNGSRGRVHSLEEKLKRANSCRGKKRTKEFCLNVSNRMKGIPKSEEHRKQLSLVKTGVPAWNKGLTKETDRGLLRKRG